MDNGSDSLTIKSPDDARAYLREVRKRHGLTQKQLADRLDGVYQSTISGIERGDTRLTFETFFTLLNAMDEPLVVGYPADGTNQNPGDESDESVVLEEKYPIVSDHPDDPTDPLRVDPETIGFSLRDLRNDVGLSRRELSRKTDQTKTKLVAIEEGRADPTVNELVTYLRVMGFDIALVRNQNRQPAFSRFATFRFDGDYLYNKRRQNDYTQGELAACLNHSEYHYRQVESGKKGMAWSIATELADRFALSAHHLYVNHTADVMHNRMNHVQWDYRDVMENHRSDTDGTDDARVRIGLTLLHELSGAVKPHLDVLGSNVVMAPDILEDQAIRGAIERYRTLREKLRGHLSDDTDCPETTSINRP